MKRTIIAITVSAIVGAVTNQVSADAVYVSIENEAQKAVVEKALQGVPPENYRISFKDSKGKTSVKGSAPLAQVNTLKSKAGVGAQARAATNYVHTNITDFYNSKSIAKLREDLAKVGGKFEVKEVK